jgi:hypothetical protein
MVERMRQLTPFSKVFSGNKLCLMFKRNLRFEDHIGPHHHIPDNEDQDGPQNIGFFYTSDVADCLRSLY